MLRIALAQIDPVIGAFEANVKQIQEAYERACVAQARLLLTPELAICGYPLLDLVERSEVVEKSEKAIQTLLKFTEGKSCAIAVGHVASAPSETGRAAQNVVSILENGKIVFRQAKSLLPTYDVFDEARYFEAADQIQLWQCDGYRVAIAICEDLWGDFTHLGKKLYQKKPIDFYREQKADLVLSVSSSPYEWNKREKRESIHQEIAKELKVPLIYVNQVGANDEILFDGGSFAVDATGKLIGRLPLFKKEFGVVSVLGSESPRFESLVGSEREDQAPSEMEVLSRGLVTGIQEYFKRTGFKSAVIGLSGGIDSAVVATLAVRALGHQRVLGVGMPSQYSSGHSLEDAEALAKKLGIPFEVRPIKFLFSTASRELSESRGQLAPLALENLQSRLRGLTLMTLSNHYSALVLTTGNKSEIAMGYCTLYGDMAGAIAPIGDLYKTRVYELARYLNQHWGAPIPERTITKAPSAELRPNQTDQDTLPPYELLDEILVEYLEKLRPVSELVSRFETESKKHYGTIRDILRKVEINEYKRRQAAPVLRVSSKAFGVGRRVPIAKTWDFS